MKNVIVRSLSGIVYIALIVGAIYAGSIYFAILASVFSLLAMIEYHKMATINEDTKDVSLAAAVVDYTFAWAIPFIGYLHIPALPFDFIYYIYLVLLYFVVRGSIAVWDTGTEALRNTAKSALGLIYISTPLYSLNMLYNYSSTLVLLMFVMIWLNDTGAFCVGSMIGKHRLCERLSPKKSWEGFWGGMAFCIGFSVWCYFLVHDLPLWQWLVIGVAISAMSTIGDLFESMIKRTVHVKDSGNLIPGHGGILDRIDSLLFVAPTMAFILFVFEIIG